MSFVPNLTLQRWFPPGIQNCEVSTFVKLDLCAILIEIFSLIIETFKRVQTAEKVLTRPHKEKLVNGFVFFF